MSTEIGMTSQQQMEAFRKRILDKLVADIGTLFPEEALNKLVEEAIKEQFFKPRVLTDGYGRVSSQEPSWFVEEVSKQAKPIITAYVNDWIKDNSDLIKQGCKTFLDQQNLLLLTFKAIQEHARGDMHELAGQIAQRIKQGY